MTGMGASGYRLYGCTPTHTRGLQGKQKGINSHGYLVSQLQMAPRLQFGFVCPPASSIPRLGMPPSISHYSCSCAVMLKETLPPSSCQAQDFPLNTVYGEGKTFALPKVHHEELFLDLFDP